jgi:hypothetical protein
MALTPSVVRLGHARVLVVLGLGRIWMGVLVLALGGVVIPLVFGWAAGFPAPLWPWELLWPVLGVGVALIVAPFVLGDVLWLSRRTGWVHAGFLALRRKYPLASVRAVRLEVRPSGPRWFWYSLGLLVDGSQTPESLSVSGLGGGPGGPLGPSRDRVGKKAQALADFLGVPLQEKVLEGPPEWARWW